MRISRHRWFLIVIPADVFLSIQNLASFFRQNFDFSEKIMCFTLYIYIIYINFVELYIRVDAFRLSKALLFPLPKNDKKLLCSILGFSYTFVSSSVNRFAISMVVRTYLIPSTIATSCRSSGSAFALGLAHPQVPSLGSLLPLCTMASVLSITIPQKTMPPTSDLEGNS